MQLSEILRRVAAGELSADEAESLIAADGPLIDLADACLDLDRARRCGLPEVIFAEGKTTAQVLEISAAMIDAGQPLFVSRTSPDQARSLCEAHPRATHHESARAVTLGRNFDGEPVGRVSVVSAGTSDLPVAEEAALTAEWMGARVERVVDVGVAGLHRLMRSIDSLRSARVVVVVAGMEGALPSVVGGLLAQPIIAVPTSVGYGTNLEGITTLLAMMTSCAPGISVVNIDNGFGAGVSAALINRLDSS
jgi:hypothetical protein